jgi:hypothetical protein
MNFGINKIPSLYVKKSVYVWWRGRTLVLPLDL